MEKENHNSFSLPVSCLLQDLTILNTPLPQATSTATKRRSSYDYINDPELRTAMEKTGRAFALLGTSQAQKSKKSSRTPSPNTKQTSYDYINVPELRAAMEESDRACAFLGTSQQEKSKKSSRTPSPNTKRSSFGDYFNDPKLRAAMEESGRACAFLGTSQPEKSKISSRTPSPNTKRSSYDYINGPKLRAAMEESDRACAYLGTSQPEKSNKSSRTPSPNTKRTSYDYINDLKPRAATEESDRACALLGTSLPEKSKKSSRTPSPNTKRQSSYSYIEDPELRAAMEESDRACAFLGTSKTQPEKSKRSTTPSSCNIADEVERSLKEAYETMIKTNEEIEKEKEKIIGAKRIIIPQAIPELNAKEQDKEITKLLNLMKINASKKELTNSCTLSETKVNSNQIKRCDEEFQFLVPGSPVSSKKFYSDLDKNNKKKFRSYRDNNTTLERLSTLPESHTSKETNKNHRMSISSSTDSSLGIISSTDLEEVVDQPLVEFTERDKFDLSHRLAKELNLDKSSTWNEKLDISQLGSAHMKERLSSTLEENKENSQQRMSIGHSMAYGRESKRGSEISAQMMKKALSEQNLITSDSFTHQSINKSSFRSNKGKESFSSNPFSDYSTMSIGSEAFQSGEDVIERLRNDEDAWRSQFGGDSIRSSLSGIYGDVDLSLRTENEKLSISSFLRSRSGPLGSLEKPTEDTQRPTFGQPVISPEKKHKARPIIPTSEERLTFSIDQVPTKDTDDSWNSKSVAMEQSYTDSDVSVPSLSCIGDLMSDKHSNQTPREMIDRLLAATQKKKLATTNTKFSASLMKLDDSALSFSGQTEVVQTIPSVVEGDNSFCRGYECNSNSRYISNLPSKDLGKVHGMKHSEKNHSTITLDDSFISSVCDVTDFDGGEAEYVCVLMPQSMVFDIINDQSVTQYYSIMKTCYLNGRRQESAALVHIPETNFILQPGETKCFSVIVAAVVEGTIKIKLDVTRIDPESQESEMTNVFGKIVAEVPKISLLSSSSLVMKPVVNHENKFSGIYQEIIIIKNSGRSLVPLKLIITQMSFTDKDIFFFNREGNKTVKFKLEPGKTLKQIINCQAPLTFEPSKNQGETFPVMACVEIHLDTTAQAQLPPLVSIRVNAHLTPNFLSAPSILSVHHGIPASCPLYNSSSSTITLQASTSPEYSVHPTMATLNPGQTLSLFVTYSGGYNKNGTLMIVTNHMKHVVKLQGSVSPRSSCNSLATPGSSRASSPTSPCSSVSARGLRIFCTQKELVWGGCPLQQRVVKTCSLKNQHTHREKLRLKITDQHHCFKILNEKNGLESEIKLSLQPMESRQISVVVVAGSIGPKWGHLTISRINSPQDKNVIPLYAFGGKAKINIENILQDPEQHKWIYLDSNSLSSAFTLINGGDHTAFFKISDGLSPTAVGGGLSIAPPEGCLQPGHSMLVRIKLYITLERLEYLLAHPSQSAICITRLSMIHGDESTRQRLGRLSSVNPGLANKMSVLNQLQSVNIANMDRLGDPYGCAETLWLEDISEWTIGILVQRSALESLRLDTSCEFVDLFTTVIEK